MKRSADALEPPDVIAHLRAAAARPGDYAEKVRAYLANTRPSPAVVSNALADLLDAEIRRCMGTAPAPPVGGAQRVASAQAFFDTRETDARYRTRLDTLLQTLKEQVADGAIDPAGSHELTVLPNGRVWLQCQLVVHDPAPELSDDNADESSSSSSPVSYSSSPSLVLSSEQ